ncbi:MAG: TerC family protein [Myxococcales bacterium]|nr:MAG: TerC family protein [Myxococcales bacterium]
MELLSDPQTYLSFLSLTALEIVLGIDNLLFISIVTSRLPLEQQEKTRKLGLGFALFGRLALLFSLGWMLSLTKPLFSVLEFSFSGRDLVLGIGGLFLIYKATQEIFFHLEEAGKETPSLSPITMKAALAQILLLDLVFSLDSIITAIGLVSHLVIMAAAIVVAVIVMIYFSQYVAQFLQRHPSMKVLGLSFLLLIAVLLVADSFGHHIPRAYVYFSLAFSMMVEAINIIHRKKTQKKNK